MVLTEGDSRHALRSLRLKPGEDVTVADGEGRVGEGKLLRAEAGRAVIEVLRVSDVHRPRPAVAIVATPPKGERLRWMVQKLSELGVDAMWLAEGDRSVRTIEDERASGVLRRLNGVAREAAMQSHQPFLMEVGLRLRPVEGGRTVMLHVGADRRLTEVLPTESPDAITLAVGPEGGFTDEEVSAAREAGSLVASLGPSVLRTETAAVVGAALVLARYGRLG
jgi:16S rRNA (uracil1498-N3)-methyltransferase